MRLATLLLVLVAGTGCGYRFGAAYTAPRTASGSLPRIAVLPFDNETFRRGLEIRLTRLVDDELRARSPRAPRDPADADWLLTGRIVKAEELIVSEDRNDVVRESSFLVEAEVSVVERMSKKTLWTYTVREREPYSPRAGRLRTLHEAQEEVLRQVAEHIVYGLEQKNPKRTT